jgi:hypothetical protein
MRSPLFKKVGYHPPHSVARLLHAFAGEPR